MTTDEIVAGIDRSLVQIATERERLTKARAQLAGEPNVPAPRPRRGGLRRTSGRRGDTLELVLSSLDPTVGRTAGEVEQITGVNRKVAGATLSRLLGQGRAAKAARGYVRAA